MIKEMSYEEKFSLLKPWFGGIIEDVKRDLRQEHLQKDRLFLKSHFGSKPAAKVTTEELKEVYGRLIEEGAEQIAEFIAARWLLKHTEVYNYFEQELSSISKDFEQLEELEESLGRRLIAESTAQFGATDTYLFAIFNSVVFPQHQLEELRTLAAEPKEEVTTSEEPSLEEVRMQYERVIDRYEKKLSGLQKKYLQDVQTLKKQIGGLQRKLQG